MFTYELAFNWILSGEKGQILAGAYSFDTIEEAKIHLLSYAISLQCDSFYGKILENGFPVFRVIYNGGGESVHWHSCGYRCHFE